MTVTSAELSQWAAHRRAVVFTVSRRVPGIDPELAASRGLEVLCIELMKQGDLSDPLTFWSTASVDAALKMAQEQALSVDGSLDTEAITAPIRRAIDFEVLNSAMERLPAGEQQILWDHHVGSRPVAAIADEIGVLPYAARRRLRRAENRLASSFAETHAGSTDDLECRTTRASMHDFVRHRLLPRRRQKVEDHMVQCADCTRAFVDVRESYWMLRAAAPVLLIGAATAAETGTVATAGVTAAGAGLGWLTTLGTRAVLTVRSALTDPLSLTATVAGGLFITTAVTTGVAGYADAATSFFDAGTVSVSAPDRAALRHVTPISLAEDPANIPDLAEPDPPGLAKNGTPPGLADKDGIPPGLAKKDGIPPGQGRESDDQEETTGPRVPVPPDQAGKDDTPPGLAKKDDIPPGQAKEDGTPPGLAKKDGIPPGHAKDDGPPGEAKKDAPDTGWRDDVGPSRSDQTRSRSTITS
ncbi:zf-HC2 domain-containing protein [Promicromonospora soli]|uniref:Putative zinc-finger domain-containing protein n=1 Tax=Promicromonospora soli TaxID=2035533 RepID=A0A919KS93_9MICO|nr:zf-HC2 domain-containing protein [Promicromonospora soli]GHH70573.1 hypothetical protein GCM10017772_17410 [Promicromonospora soli]